MEELKMLLTKAEEDFVGDYSCKSYNGGEAVRFITEETIVEVISVVGKKEYLVREEHSIRFDEPLVIWNMVAKKDLVSYVSEILCLDESEEE